MSLFNKILAMTGMAAMGAYAVDLGTHNGCAATDAQFKTSVIVTGPTPPGAQDPKSNTILKTALVKQDDGSVDVYFIQKQGAVKRYNGKSATTDDLGTITVDTRQNEYGLVGIAAWTSNFAAHPYLYFQYAHSEGSTLLTRISRFSLNADKSKLDMTSEKVLITIPRANVTWHTAGAMMFDDWGDLWITVGDNQQTDQGPGNTADFRGSILRIHPDASARGYSIPEGNFAAFFGSKAGADPKYADTNVVKPQIYVKGTRNAYTMYVDPVDRIVAWGDVGPDQGKVSEEYNIVKTPTFSGWPYYAGEQDMTGVTAYGNAGAIKAGSTKSAPVNGAGLGIKTLPAVTDPAFARNQACAMTGPIFRYDGRITNAGQMPPQLNGKWLITGCDAFGWHLMTLNSEKTSTTANQTIWTSLLRPTTIVDVKQGPDGLLYYVDYGKGTINKLEYTGTCKDPALIPKDATVSIRTARVPSRAAWLAFDRNAVSVSAPGAHRAEFLDLRGRTVAVLSSQGPATHALPALPAAGLYRLRVHTSEGEVDAAFPWMGR